MKTNWMALIFALLLGAIGVATVGLTMLSTLTDVEVPINEAIYNQLLYLTGSLWLIGGAFMLERVAK